MGRWDLKSWDRTGKSGGLSALSMPQQKGSVVV